MNTLTPILKMPPINHIMCLYGCEPLRYLSQGSLVVRGPSKISVSRKSVKKMVMKLPVKKVLGKIKQRRAEFDNEENVWLENLSLENLKLFRKIKKSGYRVINNDKLFEKLAVLKPIQLEDNKKNDSINSPKQLASVKAKNFSKQATDVPDNKLSDFLIKNMLDFPFLQSDFKNSKIDKSANGEPLRCLGKDVSEKEVNTLPSVTKILSETMSGESKFKLNLWRTKMIDELGESGFIKYKKDPEIPLEINQCNKMFVETKRKRIIVDLVNQGAMFHGSIKQYLESEGKKEVRIDPAVEGCWKSIEHCLPDISDVKLLEQPLLHPLLMYRGIVDCVASYRNVPCVIEWKKSDKKKPDLKGTYDAPLQLCAYTGALSWAQDLKLAPLKRALVVVAYTDGSPADLFPMNLEICESYWLEWLRRLQGYWVQRTSVSLQKEPAAKNLFSQYL